jgi:hypothetical protein
MTGETAMAKTKTYGERAVQASVPLYQAELDQIEDLRRAQPGFPPRAAILRQLIELGMLRMVSMVESSKDAAE